MKSEYNLLSGFIGILQSSINGQAFTENVVVGSKQSPNLQTTDETHNIYLQNPRCGYRLRVMSKFKNKSRSAKAKGLPTQSDKKNKIKSGVQKPFTKNGALQKRK